MFKEIADVWVEALRSNDYTQGSHALKAEPYWRCDTPTHCCLGVLCEIYQQQNPTNPLECAASSITKGLGNGAYEHLKTVSFDRESEVLPIRVREWAGLGSPEGALIINGVRTSLARQNDKGASFAELARMIEDNHHLL